MVSCQEQCCDKLLTHCTELPRSANRIAGYCALLGKSNTVKNSLVIWKISSLGCLLKGHCRIKNRVPLYWNWLKQTEIREGCFFLAWLLGVDQLGFTLAPLSMWCFGEVWSLLPPPKTHRYWGSWTASGRGMRQVDAHSCCAEKTVLWRPFLPSRL